MCEWKLVETRREGWTGLVVYDIETGCEQEFQVYTFEKDKFVYCPNCGEKIEYVKEYK